MSSVLWQVLVYITSECDKIFWLEEYNQFMYAAWRIQLFLYAVKPREYFESIGVRNSELLNFIYISEQFVCTL